MVNQADKDAEPQERDEAPNYRGQNGHDENKKGHDDTSESTLHHAGLHNAVRSEVIPERHLAEIRTGGPTARRGGVIWMSGASTLG